jgi:hypothetical protein
MQDFIFFMKWREESTEYEGIPEYGTIESPRLNLESGILKCIIPVLLKPKRITASNSPYKYEPNNKGFSLALKKYHQDLQKRLRQA